MLLSVCSLTNREEVSVNAYAQGVQGGSLGSQDPPPEK